jgi:hypothetical protein
MGSFDTDAEIDYSEPFRLRDRADGRLHFSLAKHMATSPKRARYAATHPVEPTLAMRRGTAIDRLVFGGSLVRCDVDRGTKGWDAIEAMARGVDVAIYQGAVRNGKEWLAFAEMHAGRVIVTDKEWQAAWNVLRGEPCDLGEVVSSVDYEMANGAAQAVMSDPKAAPFLIGERQRVLRWDMHGLPWAAGIPGKRGGLDVLGAGFINDLKATVTVQPGMWDRQIRRMLYPAQLATYREAALASGIKVDECYVTGVEVKPPFDVTVTRIPVQDLEKSARMVQAWCERIRQCEDADFWPGYTQSVVDLEPESMWDALAEAEEA